MKKALKNFLLISSLDSVFLLSGCSSQDWWSFFDIFGPFIAFGCIFFVYAVCYAIKAFIAHISPGKRLQSFSQMLQFVSNDYAGRQELGINLLRDPFILPDACFIGSDGLPRHAQTNGWGNSFTIYSTETRRGYLHVRTFCSAYACRAEHLYSLLPFLPPESWFCPRCGIPPMFTWLQKAFAYRSSFQFEMGRRELLSKLYAECNLQSQKLLSLFSFRLRKKRSELNAEYLALSQDIQGKIIHAQVLRAFNRFFLDFETGEPAKEIFVYTKKVKILYSSEPPGVPGRKEYTLEGLVEYVRHESEPPPEGCYLLRVIFPSGGYLHFEGCKNKIYPNKPVKIFDTHNNVHYIKLLAKRNFYDY